MEVKNRKRHDVEQGTDEWHAIERIYSPQARYQLFAGIRVVKLTLT